MDGLPTHDYLHMSHFSILGVYMFFMCDKVIKIILEMRKVLLLGNYLSVLVPSAGAFEEWLIAVVLG